MEGTLKSSKTVLDGLAGGESIVYSNYYRAASEYYKAGGIKRREERRGHGGVVVLGGAMWIRRPLSDHQC